MVPILIASLAGFALIVAFFLPQTSSWGEKATLWFNILAGVAFVLGGANLVKVQLESISVRRPGWGYAVITIVAFVVMLCCGLFKIGVHPAEQYPDRPWSGEYDASYAPFGLIFQYVFTPITSTMFASLAFYVASAAFRAFRAKNIEAFLLLATAFIVLLGNTAVARLTYGLPSYLSFLRLDTFVDNLMKYQVTGTGRAIKIGIALGVAATSLRILLCIDRPYLSRS